MSLKNNLCKKYHIDSIKNLAIFIITIIVYFNKFALYKVRMNDEEKFLNHGFVLKKKLFNEEEINKLDRLIQQRIEKEASTKNIQTSSGKLSMNLWNKVSDDLFGRFSTNERFLFFLG